MEIMHKDGKFWVETGHGEAHLLYRIEGSNMTIYETFVPEEERGKGIAHDLTVEATKLAKEKGLEVIPACNYAMHFMKTEGKKG